MMEIPRGFEGDDSILSGPDIGLAPKYAVKDPVYDMMDGPQATSTVDQKASRMDKMQAYLKNLDSDELERKLLEEARKTKLPITKGSREPAEKRSIIQGQGSRSINSRGMLPKQVKFSSPVLTAAFSHESYQSTNMVTDRESLLDPELSAISLINIDGMTGLSGSMIMDINYKASLGGALPVVQQSHLTKEMDGNNGQIDKKAEQDLEDVSYYDLSEGELEVEADDLINEPKGLGEQYLMNVSEKMRDHEGLDPSFELSNTQPRVWSCNTTAATQPDDASLEGLPSCLLSATSAEPLMQAQANDSLMQATHDESTMHGQVQHSFAKIPFAEAEMSARSTNFGEESKLLSDTVNSLGSFGTIPGEYHNDDFGSVSVDKNQIPEWLGFDQEELVAMTNDEEFDKIDLDFFEDEEAKCIEENQFNNPEVAADKSHFDFSTYSIKEITVRPSWISSPERELVGPHHRMPVEDYLQRRSAALGALGEEKGPRPSFGFENPVESPERPLQPLVHMSLMSNVSSFQDQTSDDMDHEDVFQDGSYLAPIASSQIPKPAIVPQSTELSKSSAYSSDDTMHESSTSDRDSHGSSNEKSNTLTATPTIDEMRTRMDINLSQADYKDASVRPDEGNSQNLSGPYLPMRGYPNQSTNTNTNDNTNVELDNAKRRKITDDLERTLNEISKPLTPRKMQCLIQAAFKSSDPRAFVQKILQFNKEKAEGHETLNSSDLEESITVLEFRRQNEEHRLRKKNEAQLEKEKQKENLIPKDIILNNESQKSHLSSFRDSTVDFDASTPFIPRSRSASGSSTSTPANINDSDNSIKMGCRPLGNSHLGNSNLGMSPNVQRPRPKMGLVSSLKLGSNTSVQNTFNRPHDIPNMGTTQNINSSSNLTVPTSQNSKSCNQQRSTSVPLGLQAAGVAKSANAHEFSSANCLKSGVNKKNITEVESIPNFPSEVIFPNVCLLGMMSQETVLFQNPVQRWVKLSLNVLKETVSGIPSSRSCLSFKTSYIVGPGEKCSINIGVCSTGLGEVEAILELRVLDLARETHSPLFSRRIFVQAVIQEPNVELITKDGNMLYFGVVAEGCTISQEVTIINRSLLSVPVILNLQQESSSMPQPIFTWGPASSIDNLTLISPVHLSLELPPAGETGPKPINATVILKAPCLNTREVGETGLAARKCQLQVQLDAPKEPTLLVSTMAVEAHIGAVKLHYKKKEPLVLETSSPTETSSTVIPLQNSSSFSIQVTLLSSEYQDLFKVYPTSLSLQPHSQGSCTLTFIPNGNIGHMESVLLMRVEPEGMTFEISIIGISNPVPSINSPRSLSPAPSSGMYSHSASMMSSVSSSSRAPSPPHSYVNQTCLPPNSSHVYGNVNFHKPLSHTNSQPASQLAPPIQSSFAIPSTAVTPATPTIAPSKEHLPKHLAVERSVSAPVAQKAFLDSTKSLLVFGTVQPGDSDSRKVVLRNNSMVDELRLLLTIRESKAFKIANCDTDDDKFECVLKPSDSIAIIIEFNPTLVDSFKGMLIIKPQKMQTASKFQIPLQGYGGKGCIKVPDSTNGEPLLIRDLAAKSSSVFHMALSNFGERAVFVKVLVYEDEDCVKVICPEEITVQPSNLVITPGNSRDVVIVVQGQSRIMSKLPGNIGTLKIVSGDEVLRKRFCALKDKEVKTRYISDVSLLTYDWNVDFVGEKDSANESDNLPQQKKEDAAIFYNNCSSQQIPLNGELMAADQSSLSFACLEAVDTMTSMVDFTTLQERFDNTKDGFSPPVAEKNNADRIPKTTVNQTWNVFPQAITIIVSDDTPQNLHVVNFSPHEQIFEVVSNVKWLKVVPREAMLPSRGTVMLSVSLVPSLVPHFSSSQLSHTIEVMCENESHSVTIKVHQALTGGTNSSQPTNASEGKSKQSIGNPDTLKQNVRDTSGTSKLSQVAKKKEVSQVSESSSIVGASQRSLEVAQISSGVAAHRGLEVPQSLIFPPIAIGSETLLKITIKNLDSVPKTMKASVSNVPFAIRHTKFKVKPGFYIGLPVVFKPTQKGIFTGQLQLFSHEDNKTHVVKLSGKAV